MTTIIIEIKETYYDELTAHSSDRTPTPALIVIRNTNTMESASLAEQDAIRRAVLLARMASNKNNNGTNSAADTKSSANNAATTTSARPAAEDAVQDGGDAIDCFASYIPTALPPCIVSMLQEKAASASASRAMNIDTSSNNGAGAGGSGTATTSSSKSNTVDDVIDLLAERDHSKMSSKKSINNVGNSDEIIEILDTDNEDSRLDAEEHFNTKKSSTCATAKSDNTNPSHDMHNIMNEKMPASKSNNDNSDTTTTSSTSNHTIFTTNQISSHTSPAVESALLSSVSAPPVPDSAAATVLPLVMDGKLSPLQAEGVCLAINRFSRVFTKKGQGKNDGFMRAG